MPSPASRLPTIQRLGQLVEHDDARSRSPRTGPSGRADGPRQAVARVPPRPSSSSTTPSSSTAASSWRRSSVIAISPVRRHAGARSAPRRASRRDGRDRQPGRRRLARGSSSARVSAATDAEVRLHLRRRGRRPTARSGRRAPAPPPCAGPGRRAGSSRASPSARSSGVSVVSMTDDEAVVVGDRGAGPRRGLDLDLVGGERLAGERHRAVRRGSRTAPSRAAAMTAGICGPEAPADPRQQHLDAAAPPAPTRRR